MEILIPLILTVVVSLSSARNLGTNDNPGPSFCPNSNPFAFCYGQSCCETNRDYYGNPLIYDVCKGCQYNYRISCPALPGGPPCQKGATCNGVPKTILSCCTSSNPCVLGGGDCNRDSDCVGDLVCGTNNCKRDFSSSETDWNSSADCCTGPTYFLKEPRELCNDNELITNLKECKSAVRKLKNKLKNKNIKFESTFSKANYPKGCLLVGVDAYWNRHVFGNAESYSRPICKIRSM